MVAGHLYLSKFFLSLSAQRELSITVVIAKFITEKLNCPWFHMFKCLTYSQPLLPISSPPPWRHTALCKIFCTFPWALTYFLLGLLHSPSHYLRRFGWPALWNFLHSFLACSIQEFSYRTNYTKCWQIKLCSSKIPWSQHGHFQPALNKVPEFYLD